MTVAPWTILSSRAAIASGRCLPSAFGMYVRREGRGRYAPRWTRPCRSSSRGSRSVVVRPHHAIHARRGFAFERVERCPEQVEIHVVEERSELLLLPLPCSFSYAVQTPGSREPGSASGACFVGPRFPWPRPWLHQLRRRSPGFVHRLHHYYAGVRLL